MAADYFLKIDGIPGESAADSKHSGEISILSWSWVRHNRWRPDPAGEEGVKYLCRISGFPEQWTKALRS